jgi:shikimate kinase
LVLATGGSAVFCTQGMAHLSRSMTMVYLYDTVQRIEKRIPNIKTRGIVGYSESDGLSAVFAQRDPLYRQWADLVFDLPIGFPRYPSVKQVADCLAEMIIARVTP